MPSPVSTSVTETVPDAVLFAPSSSVTDVSAAVTVIAAASLAAVTEMFTVCVALSPLAASVTV